MQPNALAQPASQRQLSCSYPEQQPGRCSDGGVPVNEIGRNAYAETNRIRASRYVVGPLQRIRGHPRFQRRTAGMDPVSPDKDQNRRDQDLNHSCDLRP